MKFELPLKTTAPPPPCPENKTFFFRVQPCNTRIQEYGGIRFDKICVHVLKLNSGSVDCKLWLVYVCTSASPFEKNQKQTWDIYRYMGLGSLAWKLEKKYPTLFGKILRRAQGGGRVSSLSSFAFLSFWGTKFCTNFKAPKKVLEHWRLKKECWKIDYIKLIFVYQGDLELSTHILYINSLVHILYINSLVSVRLSVEVLKPRSL